MGYFNSIRDLTARRTEFKFLTCILLVILTIGCSSGTDNEDEVSLPPDPGEAGKISLEGIDKDDDGLRDDVQRFIYLNYDSTEEREILIKYAKNIQKMIINSDNKEATITTAQNLMLQLECMMYLDPENAQEKIKNLESLLINTAQRFSAYSKANENLSGETFFSSNFDNFQNSCR